MKVLFRKKQKETLECSTQFLYSLGRWNDFGISSYGKYSTGRVNIGRNRIIPY